MPSALAPAGPAAARIATLSWIIIGIAAAVMVAVLAYLAVAILRRRLAGELQARAVNDPLVIGLFGAAIPLAILLVVFGFTLSAIAALASPPSAPRVTIDVVGHEWWWEVRYPDQPGAITANEIHIPVGQAVQVRLTSDDVIHSFWVPQLQAKMDTIPGRVNVTWLQADEAGTFRGQCAEYCGLQHAHMALLVVAEPPDQFERWLVRQSQPATAPTEEAARGMQAFSATGCITCHTIRFAGDGPGGKVGPDLTHLAGRKMIAAATLPNDPAGLAEWVSDAQYAKPGSKMPSIHPNSEQLRDLLALLQSLD